MALLDRLEPRHHDPHPGAHGHASPVNGVINGNLWIVGHGDPETGRPDMARSPQALQADGITRVRAP